jgi:hypothetical protein
MAIKLPYAFPIVLITGIFTYMMSAQAAPLPPPQTLVLKAVPVDVSQVPTPARGRAPINIHRHFANPSLLGQVKANLAAAGHGGGHGKPTPKPTPTPTPTPTPVPSPVPISSGVSIPVPTVTSFDAMNLFSGGGYVPPDTTVAAGVSGAETLVLEAVNSLGTVYDTAGFSSVNLNTTACTTNTSTDSVSDPRVLSDSGRWFISTTTFAPAADESWNLLFSTGIDPVSSSWYCLIIPTSTILNPDGTTGNFPDFPKIGINSNKVVLTGDAFSPVGSGYKFQGTEFVVINKASLLSGSVSVALFAPNQGDFAIEPAQQINSTTDSLYMAAVNSALASASILDVWTVTGVPGGTLQTTVTPLSIATISFPPNAQQKGTSALIDTNDDSLLDAVFRQGSPGSLWVSANDGCTPPGDSALRSCLRFINVSIGTGGMSVAQDFDYADRNTHYYYPAIRTDKSGNLYAAFTGSSSATYASAYAGMQLSGNPNALTNLSIIRAGDNPYTLSPPRWGDYSGAGVDPDDASVWLGAEYATGLPPVLPSYWGTAIAHAQPSP